MASNKGLGKGLGALLGERRPCSRSISKARLLLPLQKIEPNRLQPRRNFDEEELSALADSIRQHGVIQPLTVRLLDSGTIRSLPANGAGVQQGSRAYARCPSSSLKRTTKRRWSWRSSKTCSAQT